MKIKYNSPVILSFTLTASLIFFLDMISGKRIIAQFFTSSPALQWGSPVSWFRTFSHVLGHGSLAHLTGNLTFILLIGPMLEEKYGSAVILEMIAITAAATGVLNAVIFNSIILGASGIVFMLILLSSFTNIKSGEIPLTFILVAVLFLTREFIDMARSDQISQFAHILGGLCGAAFGFFFTRSRKA